MFVAKRMKIIKLNEVIELCKKLDIKYKATTGGITVYDKYNHKRKFFRIDEIYGETENIKKEIKKLGNPELQTKLIKA